jgi:hypothetical protein
MALSAYVEPTGGKKKIWYVRQTGSRKKLAGFLSRAKAVEYARLRQCKYMGKCRANQVKVLGAKRAKRSK